jgi:hypothetical protein
MSGTEVPQFSKDRAGAMARITRAIYAGFVTQGRAMRWFGKEPPKELWDEAIPQPVGDIEAAERLRNICRSAADSAAWVGSSAGRADTNKDKHERERARYQQAARAAMHIAMKMSDELMRDAGVKEIVELCLKASDLKTARILFRAVQSPSIRDTALRDYPDLAP